MSNTPEKCSCTNRLGLPVKTEMSAEDWDRLCIALQQNLTNKQRAKIKDRFRRNCEKRKNENTNT